MADDRNSPELALLVDGSVLIGDADSLLLSTEGIERHATRLSRYFHYAYGVEHAFGARLWTST